MTISSSLYSSLIPLKDNANNKVYNRYYDTTTRGRKLLSFSTTYWIKTSSPLLLLLWERAAARRRRILWNELQQHHHQLLLKWLEYLWPSTTCVSGQLGVVCVCSGALLVGAPPLQHRRGASWWPSTSPRRFSSRGRRYSTPGLPPPIEDALD